MGMIMGLVGAAILLLICSMIALGIWTYRDAKSRGLEAGMWTAIVVLVPNLIGLLLYFLIGRKQQKMICPSCEHSTELGKPFCYNCGAALTQHGQLLSAPQHNRKTPLIIALVCIVMTFTLVIAATVANISGQSGVFSSKNITIGQSQKALPGVWKLSFWYFDGKKSRSLEIKQGNPKALEIDASIEKGTVEMGFAVDGKEVKRISFTIWTQPTFGT